MSDNLIRVPIKLAVFESSGRFPYQSLYSEQESTSTDMARISEWLTVEFQPRNEKEEIVREKVAKIDREVESIKKDAMERVDKLVQRRQELLSLAYDQPVNRPSSAFAADPEDDIPF